jgi:Holliday junction resolvase RusA-like endonuclease
MMNVLDVTAMPSQTDPPSDIVLDLPAPLSVNKQRRIDWTAEVRNSAWKKIADAFVLMAKRRPGNPLKLNRIPRFEITITFDEAQTGIDLDNGVKGILDFLVLREVIEDDGQKHMRKLTVEWGYAPEGARVTVRPCPMSSVLSANNPNIASL